MEEQMRLYIRLAMEDSGFHLHTSMDNNIYNLIIVTRFPSFDTSARMRSSIFNLHFCSYESSVLQALHAIEEPQWERPYQLMGTLWARVRNSKPTVVTPRTNYGDPVGKGGRTFPERNWISCTESNSSGDSFGSRVMACVASTRSGGRTKSFSVSAGRDPVFPSEVTTNFSLSYIFLIQEEGEMCSVGTTTEGEKETGKVKVLATVDLACGGLLSTASELCTACLIIPLVLRESASCHSSPELRGSGITTGGTTGSSLDVVGVPTSITWGATPKAVNCAVIVAMALAISAICACNCNTVASVSTERGGPPCAEVEGTSASPCSSISSSISLCSSDVPRLVTTQTL
ncbi:hypothetical protein M5K25_009715 [Dendrobium thyrsiflorum]|uniref:Uncharacterized protein n=1 Tax=Dendrobium thyrsiflorum TaxID=117978 RepID=A0ABD0VDA2_DENTH